MFSTPSEKQIQDAYAAAKERYASLGIDTDQAVARLAGVTLSLHCWQGDDVGGFENTGEGLSGGIAATGNYPGKARTADELRMDLDMAYSLIPGKHRLNLHAIYAETGGQRVERDRAGIEPANLALAHVHRFNLFVDRAANHFLHDIEQDFVLLRILCQLFNQHIGPSMAHSPLGRANFARIFVIFVSI